MDASELPNSSPAPGVGLLIVSKGVLVVPVKLPSNRYTLPAFAAPVSSNTALTKRSVPNAATDIPNKSLDAGVGLLIVKIRLPLVPSKR